jgi:quercetin dioxygenase-like cupin family protein
VSGVIIRHSDEGERMWFAGGGLFTFKLTSADTGGSLLLFEDEMQRGKCTPLHCHPQEEEAIYVLDGELLVHADGEEHRVAAGGCVMAPRGVPHAFLVISETARVLAMLTPGAAEAFYRDAGEPSTSPDDATRPGDFARLRAAAERSPSIEILGPPPFAKARAGAAA